MATELEIKKARLARLQTALDDILLGNRLTSGDVDGVGNASFQSVSVKAIKEEISKLQREIAFLEGKKGRMFGTPRIGGV